MVNSIYRQLGRSVHQIFGAEGIKTAQQVAEMTARKHAQQAAAPAPAADGTAAAEPPAIPLLKSKESFKVLTECPLIVMLLFQLYPKYIKANIPDLIPLMIDALRLAPTLQRTVDGVMPQCLRARYKEMIACQVIKVKTVDVLALLHLAISVDIAVVPCCRSYCVSNVRVSLSQRGKLRYHSYLARPLRLDNFFCNLPIQRLVRLCEG